MMTKKVTDDDNFTNLSSSAQALYLHLSMDADDDGFCNKISTCMFKAHASVSDLESLLKARYIYQFENGVIVIKHWRMANALRKDRYTPTAFQEEFKQLQIKDNGSYTRLPDGCQTVATWLPDGCHSIDKNRIDKDSIEEDRVEEGRANGIPTLEEVKAFAISRNSTIDPLRFYSYYQAGGWKDPKGNPIGNWKQKFLKWENTEPEKKTAPATSNKNAKASCNNYPVVSLDDLRKSLDRI